MLNDNSLLDVLHETAGAVRGVLDLVTDWGLAGTREGQHHSDLAADEAAVALLEQAGLGVLSEESGAHQVDRDIVVALDPLDGSTNALHGLPWFATSLCAVDRDGPRAAVVVNQATGQRFEAVRGGGARLDGAPLRPTDVDVLGDALVAINGYPAAHLGWRQFRALGAAALDLCAVAGGVVDAYADCTAGTHGPWDYLGGMLICQEAGAAVAEGAGRDLVTLDWTARRMPVAAGTEALLDQLLLARRAGSDISAKKG